MMGPPEMERGRPSAASTSPTPIKNMVSVATATDVCRCTRCRRPLRASMPSGVTVLTGTVVYDLRGADHEKMRHRVAGMPEVPTGARVVVQVGALAPEPTVVRVLVVHERRLQIDLHGTAYAVRRWLEAIRAAKAEVLL